MTKKLFIVAIGLVSALALAGCGTKCENLKTEAECKKGPDCIGTYQPCGKGAFGCEEGGTLFEKCTSKTD